LNPVLPKPAEEVPLLRALNITKRFPGVLALSDVSFELKRGQVHVLVGENGAGKSTLIKIFSGAELPDRGEIYLDGIPVEIPNPHVAQQLGIFTIYQELPLVPQLTVVENVFLGRERRKGGVPFFADPAEEELRVRECLEGLEFPIDPRRRVRDLLVGEQQMVAIAKALVNEVRILILDEPTASLTDREVDVLFRLIGRLRQQGVGIIYISHRLEEAKRIGDHITVLRDGRAVGSSPLKEIELEGVIQWMVGREIKEKFPKEAVKRGDVLLNVKGLSREKAFSDVSFALWEGEILGLVGLVGSGITELGRVLFGVERADGGEIELRGQKVENRSPGEAIRRGFGYIPSDRKRQGVILCFSIRDNISLPIRSRLRRFLFARPGEERGVVAGLMRRMNIKAAHMDVLARYLSGGNQQKVVLAKTLCTQSKVFIFDQPTAGIDVASKVEIYRFMNELVRQGAGVILISSELPEVLGMCDRILVFFRGRIAAEFERHEATPEKILSFAFGKGETARKAG
jgi:ribose transport system ATP-binding protein